MSFSKFGVVGYLRESKAGEFINHLEKGRIMGTKCKGCGKAFFPPQVDCPNCAKSDVDWFEVSERGTLITYSIVHYGPAGFEDKTPYTLAVADFGNGLRVFAGLSPELDESQITIGMPLRLIPIRLPGGRISYQLERI